MHPFIIAEVFALYTVGEPFKMQTHLDLIVYRSKGWNPNKTTNSLNRIRFNEQSMKIAVRLLNLVRICEQEQDILLILS